MIISHRNNVDFTTSTCYYILAETWEDTECSVWVVVFNSQRCPHTLKKLLCALTLRKYSPTIMRLGKLWFGFWPELAMQWHVVLTGLAQSEQQIFWVALTERTTEQRTTEHTRSGLLPLAGSPPQSFMFMPLLLVATELVCVCCCAFVYACVQHRATSSFRSLGVLAHTVSQLHPAEALLLVGAATESRYETWHHGGRLTKTIRVAPWTSYTSTFSVLFLISPSTLIEPSQR